MMPPAKSHTVEISSWKKVWMLSSPRQTNPYYTDSGLLVGKLSVKEIQLKSSQAATPKEREHLSYNIHVLNSGNILTLFGCSFLHQPLESLEWNILIGSAWTSMPTSVTGSG